MPGSPTLAGPTQALDSSLNTIYSEFRMLRDETGVCRKVSSHFQLKPHTGVSKNILHYGRLEAFDLSDGVDMVQSQTLADTNTAYTPAEVGVQMVLPKSTLRRVADPELLRRTGRMMNNAYDLKEDSDGTAQFASFTPIMGSAGTVLGIGHLLAAGAVLRIGNSTADPEPAPQPYFGVLHPNQMAIVAGRLIPLSDDSRGQADSSLAVGVIGSQVDLGGRSGKYSDEIITKGPSAVGRLFDIEFYTDANITVDASADASGAVFAKEGFIYVSEVEPVMEPDEKDASLRGMELNLWGSYVWGLYRSGAFGVEILMDCTTPTS